MALVPPAQRNFVRAVSQLMSANPFSAARVKLEREALGTQHREVGAVWSYQAGDQSMNLRAILTRLDKVIEQLRVKLPGTRATPAQLRRYQRAVLFALYHRYSPKMQRLIDEDGGAKRVSFYGAFAADVARYFEIPGHEALRHDPAHLFALFFQLRRAFVHIFERIIGASSVVGSLRARVWQSIFTHDVERYERSLFSSMCDFTTLITGPTGTGKELVAQAIGLSQYIPFDARTGRFATGGFVALNLSALSPTLLESELFGHKKGAFTGAVVDRAGWLEQCGPYGAVFLDEIGELSLDVQVKLLRVLQSRTLQRIGDSSAIEFHGRVIAATNRDLAGEIRTGRFREDFYYRLCSDIIVTPALHEQLREAPDDLYNMVLFIARRVAPLDAADVACEVVAWIDSHLGNAYEWPGNFRELEQCLRNVLISGEYRPRASAPGEEMASLAQSIRMLDLPLDELVRRYCTLVYKDSGSYSEAARRLDVDRRTLRAKVLDD